MVAKKKRIQKPQAKKVAKDARHDSLTTEEVVFPFIQNSNKVPFECSTKIFPSDQGEPGSSSQTDGRCSEFPVQF